MEKDSKGLSTLVNLSDGSYVYDNLWFYTWKVFDKTKYLVSTNNFQTLINISDGSFTYKDFYAKKIYNFNDKYLVYENDKYGVFVDKETLTVIDDKIKITSIEGGAVGITRLYIDNTDKFMIGESDYYPNFSKNFTLLTNDIYTNHTEYSDYFLYIKDKTKLVTVISRTLKVIIDNILNFEPTNTDNIYLVTREDGKKSMFNIETCSYLYKDTWFYDWNYINEEMYEVKREDGLSTLIYKSDGTYVFKDLWFRYWYDINVNYFQVYTANHKTTTFINKSDGSFLFDLVPREDLIRNSTSVLICKDDNLTEFIL